MFRPAKGPRSGAAAALILCLLPAACDVTGPVSRNQVAWAKSPDSGTHAILTEINGGATTSYGYRVQLHAGDHHGDAPVDVANLYAATRSECAWGVDLVWRDPQTLEVRYREARDIELTSHVTIGGKAIRIVARPGVTNREAPCGGMLYNRR